MGIGQPGQFTRASRVHCVIERVGALCSSDPLVVEQAADGFDHLKLYQAKRIKELEMQVLRDVAR